MVALELESRAAAIGTVTLASSFLPKCTHSLQTKKAHRPPGSASFHGLLVASTKQKKKGRKSSSPARNWSYEHFMVLWDEVFEHCCTDPVKATQIRDLAVNGLAKYGRGCVLVFQEVQTRPRGPGTGFTSKPPKSSRRVPDFDTLDYHAVYLPREFLLDPRKAPLEKDVAGRDDAEQPDENAARVVVENQGGKGNAANNMAERQHKDRKADYGDGSDKVIDIQEVIRDAQDVYSFYSDEEDELDAATDDDDVDDYDDSIVGLDDREATNSLLILDDEGDATNTTVSELNLDGSSDESNGAAMNASDDDYSLPNADSKQGDSTHRSKRNSLLIFDGDNDSTPVDASSLLIFDGDNDSTPVDTSESFDKHETSVLTFNDDELEPPATTLLPAEMEPMSPDLSVGTKHSCYSAMHGTRTNTEEEITSNLKLDNENYSASRVDEISLGEDSSPLQHASGMGDVAELLEKGNDILEVHVEQNGGTRDACDTHGSVGTRVPSVELLDADTVKSTALVPVEQGDLHYDNRGSKGDEVEIATQQMLYAAMRGMDRTRLLSLTANFDFDIPRFRLKRRMAVIDVKTVDAGGEDPYNPKKDELVLLLHLLMDGKPAYGADALVAYRDEGHTVGVEKDYWKLRGKYRNIFA